MEGEEIAHLSLHHLSCYKRYSKMLVGYLEGEEIAPSFLQSPIHVIPCDNPKMLVGSLEAEEIEHFIPSTPISRSITDNPKMLIGSLEGEEIEHLSP